MKIERESFLHNDVPVALYSAKSSKRLMFVQHGIFGNKEKVLKLLGPSLVKIGYTVVAVDAKKHGERREEPFASRDKIHAELELFDIVEHTAEDILAIYSDCFSKRFDRFDILGVSMGGYIAYNVAVKTDKIRNLIALISSPNYAESAFNGFREADYEKHKQRIEKEKRKIKKMDPSEQSEKLRFERAILMNGKQDDVISPIYTQRFVEDHPNKNIVFRLYDTGHRIVRPMHEDLLELLKKEG